MSLAQLSVQLLEVAVTVRLADVVLAGSLPGWRGTYSVGTGCGVRPDASASYLHGERVAAGAHPGQVSSTGRSSASIRPTVGLVPGVRRVRARTRAFVDDAEHSADGALPLVVRAALGAR